MKPSRTLVSLALLAAGCATTSESERRSAPVTPEAQAMMERALHGAQQGGLVVDLAALEEAGLVSRQDALRETVKLFGALLPFLASEPDDEKVREVAARFVVAARVVDRWAQWPQVRGYAIAVREVLSQSSPDNTGVFVIALGTDEAENRKLLTGLLALGRAVITEELRQDMTMEEVGGDMCLRFSATNTPPVCVRPGPGYILFGYQQAIDAFIAAPPPPPSPAQPSPLLVRARLDVGEQGTVSLVVRGKDAVEVSGTMSSDSPVVLARIDQAVQKFLAEYDQRRVIQRENLARAVAQVQRDLAADAAAPADLKQAAAELTVEQVIDPDGHWQAVRQSVKTDRRPGQYTLSLTLAPPAVEELRAIVRSGGATNAAVLGTMAAVAIPNFLKFQCRAKQSEVKANLKAAFVAQRSFAAEKDRFGTSFKEVGFQPERGNRYTYCMGDECLRCTADDCKSRPDQNPCAGMSGVGRTLEEGFQVCAYANLDRDGEHDIWMMDDSGRPQQAQNDCE